MGIVVLSIVSDTRNRSHSTKPRKAMEMTPDTVLLQASDDDWEDDWEDDDEEEDDEYILDDDEDEDDEWDDDDDWEEDDEEW